MAFERRLLRDKGFSPNLVSTLLQSRKPYYTAFYGRTKSQHAAFVTVLRKKYANESLWKREKYGLHTDKQCDLREIRSAVREKSRCVFKKMAPESADCAGADSGSRNRRLRSPRFLETGAEEPGDGAARSAGSGKADDAMAILGPPRLQGPDAAALPAGLSRYAAHIEEIDYEEGKVLIHFKRWNHRYDEWFCWDSPYLRPLEKIQLRREGLVEDEPTTVFRVNEQVLACWSDCRFYPAKITSVNKDGTYTVKFFDGVIQTVKNIHVKAFSKDQANAARSKHRERPTESTSPSDKQRGKFREQRKSSENTTTIEKEKTQTPDKKAGQAHKDKKPVPCEKGKAPAVKNEKEDKENISENERDSSAETRMEERSGQNDSLKVPHENGDRRRKRDRSSSLTSGRLQGGAWLLWEMEAGVRLEL
ncbi:unnamed protein product [Ranitomeya imitator]|uniref:Tudor domain-containing protein n=1 Tax=Ranitomeya imitator TaxID=111125 RepID=A0ABN9MDI5_9NEOB|nr:unnamed protein product [Ranitomeya imitator]